MSILDERIASLEKKIKPILEELYKLRIHKFKTEGFL